MRPPASTFCRAFSPIQEAVSQRATLVDRSYGTRVVQAVLDNLADFGITQLPVQEKKLQVVKIHSDEIKLLVPAGHRLASQNGLRRPICWASNCCCQNRDHARTS